MFAGSAILFFLVEFYLMHGFSDLKSLSELANNFKVRSIYFVLKKLVF